jgi:sugar lactone lactonase YvrE
VLASPAQPYYACINDDVNARWSVTPQSPPFRWIGRGLNRPECVLTHSSGWTFAASWNGNGGVSAISPGGGTTEILAADRVLRPNGIALEPGGTFLLAHLGAEDGGVFRLFPDGATEPVLTEVAGRPIPPSNFPVVDTHGRLWLSVSTTVTPRARDYRPDARSGLLIMMDGGEARIVADDIGYANEFLLSPDGRTLYINETFGRRIRRYAVVPDGGLSRPEIHASFGEGTYPDGLAMDAEGGLWVTSIVSNRVIRVHPDGHQDIVVEDCDPAHLRWVEEAFQSGEMGRPHLDGVKSSVLRNISCLAFGGPDLRTGYLGCLLGDSIATVALPVAGQATPHFSFNIDGLIRSLT